MAEVVVVMMGEDEMKTVRVLAAVALLGGVFGLMPAAWAEDFEWIMTSVAGAGQLPNGDGHYWTFVKNGDAWKVIGKDGASAKVTQSAENVVEISGFPRKWKANGEYKFSKTGSECRLKSSYSRHNMKWDC